SAPATTEREELMPPPAQHPGLLYSSRFQCAYVRQTRQRPRKECAPLPAPQAPPDNTPALPEPGPAEWTNLPAVCVHLRAYVRYDANPTVAVARSRHKIPSCPNGHKTFDTRTGEQDKKRKM